MEKNTNLSRSRQESPEAGNQKLHLRRRLGLAAGLALASAATTFSSRAQADSGGDTLTLRFDVAQDAATNAQNDIDPKENKKNPDLFSRGDTFILGGNLYPYMS